MNELKKNLDNLQDEIHRNAIAHGWWEEDRNFGEICALIHSELSEALEEYRNGRDIYYTGEDGKPEGIGIELADVIIRILDWFGREGLSYTPVDEPDGRKYRQRLIASNAIVRGGNFGVFIAECHYLISMAYSEWRTRWKMKIIMQLDFSHTICLIWLWSKNSGVDIFEMIRIKHEYNKTRPYRHGGKKI